FRGKNLGVVPAERIRSARNDEDRAARALIGGWRRRARRERPDRVRRKRVAREIANPRRAAFDRHGVGGLRKEAGGRRRRRRPRRRVVGHGRRKDGIAAVAYLDRRGVRACRIGWLGALLI